MARSRKQPDCVSGVADDEVRASGKRLKVQRYIVKAAAWLEIVVGAIFVTVPDIPCLLVFGAKPESVGRPLAHWIGVALIALGIACLPSKAAESQRSAVLGLLVFNIGATILFLWVGVTTVHGFALWPVVILHAVIAVALLLRRTP
jgi:hypothetical protein